MVVAFLWFRPPAPAMDQDTAQLVAAVQQAGRERATALGYFHSVTDPDLVDQAVLQLLAAERRYSYLLRQARRKGVEQAEPGGGAATVLREDFPAR